MTSQGNKGERGPIGVPGAQGLSGTKGDKVCVHVVSHNRTVTQAGAVGAVFIHESQTNAAVLFE